MPKGRPWESGTGDWLADAVRAAPAFLAAAVRAAPAFLAAHLLACRGEIEGPIRLTVLVGRCPAWTASGVKPGSRVLEPDRSLVRLLRMARTPVRLLVR
jgi:hypothetical protein